MKTVYPKKLKKGDEIRIVAPAGSLETVPKSVIKIAKSRLEWLGFIVTFGKNVFEKNMLNSSSIKSRLNDLEDAFRDKNVKMILAARGGYNSNQLLNKINYQLIKDNPKILCGFSDITALTNAIYAKTGLVTFSGPNFSSFGMKKGFEYTEEYFLKCMVSTGQIEIKPSIFWSDDVWIKNQKNRIFKKNLGYFCINPGKATGTIIGGNLCTLNLLQGTSYMPKSKSVILFIEDDNLPGKDTLYEFGRNFVSLLAVVKNVKGLVIGRFQKKSFIKKKKLIYLIKSIPELKSVPVIANADFGHTYPQFTFPIGGSARIMGEKEKIEIEIVRC